MEKRTGTHVWFANFHIIVSKRQSFTYNLQHELQSLLTLFIFM